MEQNRIIQKCIFRLSWISGVHNICMPSWDACSIGFKLLIFITILLVFTLALYWIYVLIMLLLHAREEFELLSALVLRLVSSWPFCRGMAVQWEANILPKATIQELTGKNCSKAVFLWMENDFLGSVCFMIYVDDRIWLRFRQLQVQLFSDLFQLMQQNILNTKLCQWHNLVPTLVSFSVKKNFKKVFPCCAL